MHFFGALALLASCAGFPPPGTLPARGTRYESVYQIAVYCPGTIQGGTAFAIGPRTLVTARHVVRCIDGPAEIAIVKNGDGPEIGAGNIHLHPSQDVAILTTASVLPSWTGIGAVPSTGDEVCMVTGRQFTKCGRTFPTDPGSIGAGIRGIRGNSGSPLFDSSGRVVGVLSMATIPSIEVEDFVLAVPASAILELL